MKAMILAAGYGTRLRPLTYTLPKPLFPVCNRPLLATIIEGLLRAGVDEIVVNLHHLPDAIEEFLAGRYDCTFHFSLEREILGTGGAVRRVREILSAEEDFLLVNGDTLQFPRYEELLRLRRDTGAITAMLLRHPPAGDRFTPVWLDHEIVSGFGSGSGEALMFSGVHALSSAVFDEMPDRDEFSIVDDVYRRLAATRRIAGMVDDGRWFDLGTPRRYLGANAGMASEGQAIDGTATIAGIAAASVIGAGTTVEGEVRESVLWDRCHVGAGVRLTRCIVGSGVELTRPIELADAVICMDDVAIPRDDSHTRADGLVIAPS